MNKVLFSLLIFSSLIKAELLMTLTMNDSNEDYTFSRCIDSFFTSDSRLYYHKTADDTTYSKDFTDIKFYTIEDGYILESNGACNYAHETDNITINIEDIYIFFASILLFIAVLWGIKKGVSLVK